MVSSPQVSPPKPLYAPLLTSIRATCPVHLILLDLITRTILSKQYKSLSSSLCSFLPSPVTSSLLGPYLRLVLLRNGRIRVYAFTDRIDGCGEGNLLRHKKGNIYWKTPRELLLLSSSLSSSSSPLRRVFILTFLRNTMSLGNIVLQLFCCYYSRCLYH